MITINNIKLPTEYEKSELKYYASKALKISVDSIKSARLQKISIDARKKQDIHYVANLDVEVNGNENAVLKRLKGNAKLKDSKEYNFSSNKKFNCSPVVVGAGPAGLFCALLLARNGAKPIIIERGEKVEDRTRTIESFWNGNSLNPMSNVQFGEGGAGTFSDGKLNTGTKDYRQGFILREFVNHGASEDILTNAKPHIGTDRLKNTIIGIREEIESLGGIFKFSTLFTDFSVKGDRICEISVVNNGYKETISTENLVLATGHSARDTFSMLKLKGVEMEQKAFSIGARIEHGRDFVNYCQYGAFKDKLPTADYKLSTHLSSGRGVYTFCMCPGGYVVNASSEEGMLCTNGMSNFMRDASNSNSAVLVSVLPSDFDCGDVLDGIKLQRKIEQAAYNKIGNNIAPVERISGFLDCKSKIISSVEPSIKPGYEFTHISDIFPDFIANSLKEGIFDLSKKSSIFADFGGVLTAAETRSSSPVRIVRNEELQSVTVKGLYPCGEGAGYAGGIMSAACDGLKCAEKILS
ncbi:MAG: FAD-dependent oxidoreductase [Eubacteriales bacterium]|nr:FAD-dependent oxidoreductase [Eubacteriales bacterium]